MTHFATETSSSRGPLMARPAEPNSQSATKVRLPDLTGERKSRRIDSAVASETTPKASAAMVVAPTDETAPAARLDLSKEQLIAKAMGIVRQPKFWLACVVFIGVQIVLALVVPPNDEAEEPLAPPTVTQSSEPDSVPAARIVVPAAPTPPEVIEPAPATGVTTPMGAALQGEPADAKAPGDAAITMDEADAPGPVPRMADSRSLGDGTQFDGRTTATSDGATLGGIMPLAPTPETTGESQ